MNYMVKEAGILLCSSRNSGPAIQADCGQCFGLCCVALPYAKSADFAFDKEGGSPCRNLQADYRCGIHADLREKGFKGCTVYECFGAGQNVSQSIYEGKDWRKHPELSDEMFRVFPIMQQLHEMLYYLHEALQRREAESIRQDLRRAWEETERLTVLESKAILRLDVPAHRATVNPVLLQTSRLVRGTGKQKKAASGMLIGAKLRGTDLRGADFRGALLIAADLRGADLRKTDWIGADLRDADISGADLTGSIFLTQAQINAAKGSRDTKLPTGLDIPAHWLA